MSGARYKDKDIVHEKVILRVDSEDRDVVAYPNANKFIYPIPDGGIQNVVYMKLIDAEIPVSDYNVNEYNNGFVLVDDGVEYPIELPIGDYDVNKLIVELGNVITPLATTNVYSFSVVNGKLVIEGTGGTLPFELRFAPPAQFADEHTLSNFGTSYITCFNQSARKVLGFDIADYTSVGGPIGVITSPNKIDLTGDKYIGLDLGLQINAVNSKNESIKDVFYIIPMSSPRNTVNFTFNDYNLSRVMPTPIRDLKEFNIELKTTNIKRLYNLRGLNFSFGLEIGSAPN